MYSAAKDATSQSFEAIRFLICQEEETIEAQRLPTIYPFLESATSPRSFVRDNQYWFMSKWLNPLLFGIWGILLIPLIATSLEKWFAQNISSEPDAIATAIFNNIVAVSDLRWFKFALVFMTGVVIGIALQSSARKAGERRAFELRSLGYKFRSLHDSIQSRTASPGWPENARDIRPAIMSASVSAKRFDLWVPSERVYELPDASFLCEYFRSVGVLLQDGRLDEASREALSWKPFLDRAKLS